MHLHSTQLGGGQGTSKQQHNTTAHTSYVLHDVIHNARDIVQTVLEGELHDIKPGNVSNCSCCRHMHDKEHDACVNDSRETLKPVN